MAYASRQAVIDLDSEPAFDVTDQLKYPALHGQLADVHHAHLRFPIQYEDGSLKRFEVNHFITLPQSNVTSAPDRPFGWHELCPIHSALQKLCLRTGAEYRLLFPKEATCIHISGVTISAENMGVCNRLAWHISYHYEHLLSNRAVYMSPQDQRLGTSELLATSDAAAFSSPFDLPPEWTVLRNTTRSVLRDDLPHFFTYHQIQPKVEQLKKKATAVQRRAVQDENIALQGLVADLKEWLSTYERLLHFAATFHPHYEDYIGATQ